MFNRLAKDRLVVQSAAEQISLSMGQDELVYHESQASRSVALKRELAIKAMSRQEKEAMIRLER